MYRQYSIAQARDQLAKVIREAECGSPIEVTRRGKPVAVILSLPEYQQLSGMLDFWTAVQQFRQSPQFREVEFTDEVLEGLRDRSPGRSVDP